MALYETVLVTGGTGFIGAYTVRQLVDDGQDVVAFDVSTDARRLEWLGVADDVALIGGDVTDPTDVFRAVGESDATQIIHLGAMPSSLVRRNPRGGIEANVVGTNNVLEAARVFSEQVDRVVWASSMAVYAPPNRYGDHAVDEDDLVYPNSLYGATKAFNEHQARRYREDFGVSAVGLRPTFVYGPSNSERELDAAAPGEGDEDRSPSDAFGAQFARAALGRPVTLSAGNQTRDWIHVVDVARLVATVAFAPAADCSRQVYNCASGEVATVRKVAELLGEFVPDAAIEVSDEGSEPLVGRIDASAAAEDFGFEASVDLKSGIRDYADTIRESRGLDPVA